MREKYEKVGEAIVVKDKEPGSGIIYCVAFSNTTNTDTILQLENQVELPNGEMLDCSDVIMAYWYMTDSNRRTAPDVTKNSKVTLYKHPAGDEYYWREESSQLDLRKLEEVTWMFSNRREGADSPEDQPLETCNYMFTISTLNKTIRLDTSMNDEEPVGYIINLDTAKGCLILEDTNKNIYCLDSANSNRYSITIDGDMRKTAKQVNLIEEASMTYNRGDEIKAVDGSSKMMYKELEAKVEKVSADIKELVGLLSKIDLNVTDDVSLQLGKLLLFLTSGDLEVAAANMNVMAANTTFTGAVNVAGGIVVNSFSVGGAAPKVVNPPQSNAKPVEGKAYDDTKQYIIDQFEHFKGEDDEETKEPSESEDTEKPQDPEAKQQEPEKPTSFQAEVDEPIVLKSKTGGVDIGGAGNINIESTGIAKVKGNMVEIGNDAGTVGSLLSELVETLMSDVPLIKSTAPGAAVEAASLVAKLTLLLPKIKAVLK